MRWIRPEIDVLVQVVREHGKPIPASCEHMPRTRKKIDQTRRWLINAWLLELLGLCGKYGLDRAGATKVEDFPEGFRFDTLVHGVSQHYGDATLAMVLGLRLSPEQCAPLDRNSTVEAAYEFRKMCEAMVALQKAGAANF